MTMLPILDLSTGAFAPFGAVINDPDRSATASGPGWNWWGELVQMEGGDRQYAVGYLKLEPAALHFDWAERHMHTDELLVPLTGNILVYVGPPEYPNEPDRLPSLDEFKVFRVRQGQGVLLKPGVWHGAPLADGQPANVLVILLHNTARQDTALVRFENTPVTIVHY